MNSEELEQSLRTEFESYLKSVLAEMRQEATEFQNKIEAEFDKHKSQFDEAFQLFVARFDSDREFDEPFKESVTEHLRLARDEGSKIAANAFAEAEDMERAAAAPVSFDEIRDAVNDISSKDSQSSILKSLVQQAAKYAPRGAFFIIKNGQFVGWKIFGKEGESAERAIREIHFPTSSDSILGSAVRSLATVDSSFGMHADDPAFLNALQFGQPDRMYAIPLVARGRGVAVMYADYGTQGVSVNLEALETLVRVAALTVELLASTQTAAAEHRTVAPADFEDAQPETDAVEIASPVESHDASPVYEIPAVNEGVFENETPEFAFGDSVSRPGGLQHDVKFVPSHEFESPTDDAFPAREPIVEAPRIDAAALSSELRTFEPDVVDHHQETEVRGTDSAFVFDSGGSIETAAEEGSPFDKAADNLEPVSVGNGSEVVRVAEPVTEVSFAQIGHGRLSDRPVDLPINVPDDERRLHNDARRFARLLVSEIKLYNEKKVQEGREANDLYERLREAIDRSREMYDKRVQPPVAAKFDYFHYELVTALAEGEEGRLGQSYPGSTV